MAGVKKQMDVAPLGSEINVMRIIRYYETTNRNQSKSSII